jgi:hypothetical protein
VLFVSSNVLGFHFFFLFFQVDVEFILASRDEMGNFSFNLMIQKNLNNEYRRIICTWKVNKSPV